MNWVFLFTAFLYTTLVYYIAPIIGVVISASSLVRKSQTLLITLAFLGVIIIMSGEEFLTLGGF